jgi:hypothetical protein
MCLGDTCAATKQRTFPGIAQDALEVKVWKDNWFLAIPVERVVHFYKQTRKMHRIIVGNKT